MQGESWQFARSIQWSVQDHIVAGAGQAEAEAAAKATASESASEDSATRGHHRVISFLDRTRV